MENFFLIYLLPVLVINLTSIGEPDSGDVFAYSLIPGINILFAGVSLVFWFKRIYTSKGKCIVKHDFEMIYDSESEKWKNGRMPATISMGGITKYKCSRCHEEKTTSWKAF
jgi:hypothetical protein